jgi:hypothetical protein
MTSDQTIPIIQFDDWKPIEGATTMIVTLGTATLSGGIRPAMMNWLRKVAAMASEAHREEVGFNIISLMQCGHPDDNEANELLSAAMIIALSSGMPVLQTMDLSAATLTYEITLMSKGRANWRLTVTGTEEVNESILAAGPEKDEQPDPLSSFVLWGEDGPPSTLR